MKWKIVNKNKGDGREEKKEKKRKCRFYMMRFVKQMRTENGAYFSQVGSSSKGMKNININL